MAQVLKKFAHGMRRWLVGDEISPSLLGNRETFDQLVKLGHIGEKAPAAAEEVSETDRPAAPAAHAAQAPLVPTQSVAPAAKPAE